MFPYRGIMANEEPKTAISASGLYNTSKITPDYNDRVKYSEYFLAGLSEFTLMAWLRYDVGGGQNTMYIHSGLYIKPDLSAYTGKFFLNDNSSNNIYSFKVMSSAGVSMTVQKLNHGIDGGLWHHLCVTGSVTDNELKLFHNGSVVATSTMPYSIAQAYNNATSPSFSQGLAEFSISQENVYNRRLTEAEVAEHYVYDDDTMTSGVLGFDAMTPAQKSGLIYSSSFTKDISISGNEFTDKSGNNITLSPQPSLTGEQIYVYTNASDLPSSTTIYDVNSANLNGTSNELVLLGNSSALDLGTQQMFVTARVFINSADNKYQSLYIKSEESSVNRLTMSVDTSSRLEITAITNSGSVNQAFYFNDVLSDGWHDLAINYHRTSSSDLADLYIDGQLSTGGISFIFNAGDSSTANLSYGGVFRVGNVIVNSSPNYQKGSVFIGVGIGQQITQAEVTELHNDSTQIAPCYADLSTALKNKYTEFWDLATYNGSTELQARTGHKNGWVLDNTSATPFTDQGLQVECEPSDTTIYDVNSATLNGTTQSFTNSSYDMTGKFTNFSWSTWVELSDTGSPQSILRSSKDATGDIALMFDWTTLDPTLDGKITIGWFSGSWNYVSTTDFALNQWLNIVVAKSGLNWKLYINGSEKINHTAVNSPYEANNAIFGTQHNTGAEKLASPCSEYYISNVQLDQTDVNNLYNGGTPPCVDDLPTVTKNKMTNHWTLGTFNGSTAGSAVLDTIGSVDFTNNGSTPFTDQGLQVECTN